MLYREKYRQRSFEGRDQKTPPALVIAGAASGVGKTTVAVGIMGALRRRGLRSVPFKVGPDYIDPGFHFAAAGVPARNLDLWLTGRDAAIEIYARGAAGADLAVIEGVMGLFDGRTGTRGEGSTAEVAALLGGAVVLVVDCSSMARSLAPLLSGFSSFDREVNLIGAVLNNVGSEGHARALREAAREVSVPVLGMLPRRAEIALPSRHLGLVPAAETGDLAAGMEQVIDHVETHLDLDALLSAVSAGRLERREEGAEAGRATVNAGNIMEEHKTGAREAGGRIRLAVADDEAFSFYYLEGLEALVAAGAELAFFSPLADSRLPDCDGVYLGGGFPEMFAAELEANGPMRRSLAAAAKDGMPVYAECGGLIYLCRSVSVKGCIYPMAGVIDAEATMSDSRQALGYVEARALSDNLLLRKGESIRGHEFHWSTVRWPEGGAAYDVYSPRRQDRERDGFAGVNLLASFVHVDFAGNPAAAKRFVAACEGSREVVAGASK